jgi:hypothetical protein
MQECKHPPETVHSRKTGYSNCLLCGATRTEDETVNPYVSIKEKEIINENNQSSTTQ